MSFPSDVGAVDLFKGVPDEATEDDDPIEITFRKMDAHNITAGLFGVSEQSLEARRRYPGRVYLSLEVDPNDITGTVRQIRTAHADHGIKLPELRIVMRHGAEPWGALAVKLMLKWPGLYYVPSAFAPEYYPRAIVDLANSRGSERSCTRVTTRPASPSSAASASCPTCR